MPPLQWIGRAWMRMKNYAVKRIVYNNDSGDLVMHPDYRGPYHS